jgi:hypothetical protein
VRPVLAEDVASIHSVVGVKRRLTSDEGITQLLTTMGTVYESTPRPVDGLLAHGHTHEYFVMDNAREIRSPIIGDIVSCI